MGIRLSEHQEQALFVQEVNLHLINRFPEVRWLFAIPNEGGSGFNGVRRGMQIKAEGGKPGPCDLCLPVPRFRPETEVYDDGDEGQGWSYPAGSFPCFMGLYIEMKRSPKVSPVRKSISYTKPDPDQQAFIDFERGQGYVAECANGRDEAIDVLVWYLNLEKIDPRALQVDYSRIEERRKIQPVNDKF